MHHLVDVAVAAALSARLHQADRRSPPPLLGLVPLSSQFLLLLFVNSNACLATFGDFDTCLATFGDLVVLSGALLKFKCQRQKVRHGLAIFLAILALRWRFLAIRALGDFWRFERHLVATRRTRHLATLRAAASQRNSEASG